MNKAQKFLLENNLSDIVLNAKQYPKNTPGNAKKWVYLSDVLEQYLAQNQALRIHDVRRSGFGGWKWWISYILALILLGAANWLLHYV